MNTAANGESFWNRLAFRLRTDVLPTAGMLGLMALAMALVGK
jgi:hypothetical protein